MAMQKDGKKVDRVVGIISCSCPRRNGLTRGQLQGIIPARSFPTIGCGNALGCVDR
jgi:hypothetical protein